MKTAGASRGVRSQVAFPKSVVGATFPRCLGLQRSALAAPARMKGNSRCITANNSGSQEDAASTSSFGPDHSSSTPRNEPEASKAGQFPHNVFKGLQDFGAGGIILTEGGVGLFLAFGTLAALALLNWAKGTALKTGKPYHMIIELPLACGVHPGTPVRIRQVQIGQVLEVKPTLERVDVMCEVADVSVVIPRNSVVQANQSGLTATPQLDIVPGDPMPEWRAAPTDPQCEKEGSIVCANGRIEGKPGVAMDDLIYIMTRLARQTEDGNFDKAISLAENTAAILEDARPLLQRSIALAGEVTPLLQQLREGGMVAGVEALTQNAAAAAEDIRKLQGAMLTDDNVRALRRSVLSLTQTLQHVEAVSGEVAGATRDSQVQRNLRTLVQALSQLVDE